ncbi:MAG: MOSC domain-containing protein [Daejeonella sp.]|uniref:MOSC domain-containing protein n=1 Tax=Daejeonella sp. TaxID=2805397 RepID=UPI003C70A54A
MSVIEIVSINILGKPEVLVSDHQTVKTAYKKVPIKTESLLLGMTSFEGDMVQDKKHHGGNDKAICCYNSDHFIKWTNELGFELDPAAFGENLTLRGEAAHESNVFIGDRYQLGEAVVEVSEPRGPCYVIGIRYNYKQFPVLLQNFGFTGFYLRTITPGLVKITDKLVHISSHPENISVMDVNYIRYHDSKNKEEIERLVNLKELSEDWKEMFEKKLRKL